MRLASFGRHSQSEVGEDQQSPGGASGHGFVVATRTPRLPRKLPFERAGIDDVEESWIKGIALLEHFIDVDGLSSRVVARESIEAYDLRFDGPRERSVTIRKRLELQAARTQRGHHPRFDLCDPRMELFWSAKSLLLAWIALAHVE